MKTKISSITMKCLKLLLVIPVLILMVAVITSCAARKKSATQTEVAPPPPPPPPPPPVPSEEVPFVVVEEMPVFPGGDTMLLKYIAENTKYPAAAKEQNIQGRVIIRFCITEKGGVSQVKVIKGVSPELDAEAVRVVNTLPAFIPGKQGGKEVPVWYMVPITFALKGDGPKRPSYYQVIGTDTIYSYTKEMPQFPGGTEEIKKYTTENLKYPQEVKNLGIEGGVMVRFNIEKNGAVSNIQILNGISPALDAEAIRLTRAMPAWIPGRENGKPVKFMYMTSYRFQLTPPSPPTPPVHEEGTPYVVVEEMPMFPGGDEALLKYIAENTKYPEDAKKSGVEGRVIIRFCVTDSGSIDRVSVLKGVDSLLDAEATRVVKSLPEFKTGKQGGKPVNVWYMVPITFGLNKSATKTGSTPPMPSGYDEPPVFEGGEVAMYKFINSKLVYPAAAKAKKLSGKVIVRFSVDIDGSTGGVSVVIGISPELDAEAIRVVQLLPPWKPGKLAGSPVKVWYMIPVTFTMK